MTTALTPVAVDEQNPWPGLASFDESAERFFHGRGEEQAALRRLVTQAPLTVLFGASGLGKTSLLQAGLFPTLRLERYLPVYVRLDLTDDSGPLVDQLAVALWQEVKTWRVDAPAAKLGESTWEYLHRDDLELWSRDNQLLTPVFVLDQFEEVFTLGAARPAERERLIVDLADLIENRIPEHVSRGRMASDTASGLSVDSQRYKVVLGFREDFLPAVEGLRQHVPSIMRNRLRLLPMTGQQAFDAVHGSASHLLDESIAWRIVAFVSGRADPSPEAQAGVSVEPALLSLVCRGLNERRKRDKKARFDQALVSGTGREIVADFYVDAVADLPRHVRRFIQQELITERGFRKPCDVDDARRVHKVGDAHLRTLVDRRVLRIEPVRGTERIELTHDLLTPVVREQRDRDRGLRERTRIIVVATASLLIAAAGLGFGLWANAMRRTAEENQKQANEARVAADLSASQALAARLEAERNLRIANEATSKSELDAKEADAARRAAEASRRAAEASRTAEAAAADQARLDRQGAEEQRARADVEAKNATKASEAANAAMNEAVAAKQRADTNAREAQSASGRANRQRELSVAQQLAARARVLQRSEDLPLAGQMAVHAYVKHRDACRPELDGAETCTTDPFDANILPALQTVLNRLTRQYAASAPGAGGVLSALAGGSGLRAVQEGGKATLLSARAGGLLYRVTPPFGWREPFADWPRSAADRVVVESLARLQPRTTAVSLPSSGTPVAAGALDGSVSVLTPSRTVIRPPGPSAVVAIALAPDRRTHVLATADGSLERRNDATVLAVARVGVEGTPPAVHTIAFSADDATAYVGTSQGLYRWQLTSPPTLDPQTKGLDVRSIAFAPDGGVAIGDSRGTVLVRAPAAGRFSAFAARHASAVNALAFSPSSHLLATAGADGTVRVYPAAGDSSPAVFTEHTGAVESLAFPDDGVVITGGADRTLRQWSTRMDHLISSLCRMVCRDCPHPLQRSQELASALGGDADDACARKDLGQGGAGGARVR